MANFPGEKITEGLDGLPSASQNTDSWERALLNGRAVITIGGEPSHGHMHRRKRGGVSALCGALSEGDLVPIVEPEVLMDGAHTIERCFEVTQQTLESVCHALYEHRVSLEGMLLKPNMVLSGKECPQQASVQEVA